MELLYNPEQMSENELRATFVAREGLLEALLSIIANQPKSPGVQHVIISGSRGLGKTTLLLMLRLRLQESDLTASWQPLKLPEETYGITDLADLWCEILSRLAIETGDSLLQSQLEKLTSSIPESKNLADAALALLRDWSRRSGKRLLLMVENLDQLLDQIGDEQDHSRLRDVLMNDGMLMMLATATSYFREAYGYDHPLYNFFKVYDLRDLKLEDIKTLLSRRAIHDGNFAVEKKLQNEDKRLHAMRHFTGGNPRLVLMFYRIITLSGIDEVRRALEKLLDEITPYYQSKTQSLAPQQRKILDHLALTASQRREALTPGEIATATRLPANQAATQLKRLADLGYVTTANIRGRRTYYTLSEPLYSVWYQMRFGREAKRRIEWLVTFLRLWYTTEEILEEGKKLETRFTSLFKADRLAEARALVEDRRYLVEATEGQETRARAWEWVVQRYFELGDDDSLREHLKREEVIKCLPAETAEAFREAGYLSVASSAQEAGARAERLGPGAQALQDGRFEEALHFFARVSEQSPNEAGAWIGKGFALSTLGRNKEALTNFERALTLDPERATAWRAKGLMLGGLGRHEEALADFERALALKPDALTWRLTGLSQGSLGRLEEALASFEQALALQPDDAGAAQMKGFMLSTLNRDEEALASFERALASQPENPETLRMKSVSQGKTGRHEEALLSCERALALQPDNALTWRVKGLVLGSMGRYEEALVSCERALALQPEDAQTWRIKGFALDGLDRNEAALASFEWALVLQPEDTEAWWAKGLALSRLDREEEALVSFEQALALQPEDANYWGSKGVSLVRLGRFEEAVESLERALALQPQEADVWRIKGAALIRLNRDQEALASLGQVLALQPKDADAWELKGLALSKMGRYPEALASYEQALQVFDREETDPGEITQVAIKVFTSRVELARIDEAKQDWKSLLKLTETLDDEQRQEILLAALKEVAGQGHFELARQLITESNLEEALFPFARALDYAMSGDRALIEKLPPELRSVVEEIVATLPSREDEKTADTQPPKVRKRRRRSLSQSRKRLS